ncbi:MAG TPA: hypothetical protein IGS51_14175 [Thermoleptolyngbya sp. M55_K2018_002]|nr:hypothetical protein [Thermoleptolyngbya sp. M55_K2018_002]
MYRQQFALLIERDAQQRQQQHPGVGVVGGLSGLAIRKAIPPGIAQDGQQPPIAPRCPGFQVACALQRMRGDLRRDPYGNRPTGQIIYRIGSTGIRLAQFIRLARLKHSKTTAEKRREDSTKRHRRQLEDSR